MSSQKRGCRSWQQVGAIQGVLGLESGGAGSGPNPSALCPRGRHSASPSPPFLIHEVRVPIPASQGCREGRLRKNPNVWGNLRCYRRRGKTFLCVKLQKKPMVVRASSRELQRTWSHCWDRTESLDSAAGRDVPPRKAMLMHDSHDRQTRPHWETGSLLGSSS